MSASCRVAAVFVAAMLLIYGVGSVVSGTAPWSWSTDGKIHGLLAALLLSPWGLPPRP